MNQKLLFMHLPQGYINVLEGHKPPQERLYDYVYQYKDHLEDGALKNSPVDCFSERARRRAGSLSFAYDRDRREVRSLTEHNYYPFGLEHSYLQTRRRPELVDEIVGEININSEPSGRSRIVQVDDVRYQYKFQGQERQDELGLNWDSFKWRNYDYAIGRFMSIDPLSEKYVYNSTYAFQENKMGLGRELEGLEMVSERSKDGKSVTITYRYNPVNKTNLPSNTFDSLVKEQAKQVANTFNGKTSDGVTVNTVMIRDENATITWEYQPDMLETGTNDQELQSAFGKVDHIGNTQVNRIQINMYAHFGKDGELIITDEGREEAKQTVAHESAHLVGSKHADREESIQYKHSLYNDINNVMHNGAGKLNMLPWQRSRMIQLIEEQQP